MSIRISELFHWSPADRRASIIKRGLRPSTPTLIEQFVEEGEGPFMLRPSKGVDTVKAVCLGTTPSHAWSLCGAIWGDRDETWDLWQVSLVAGDEIRVMPCDDAELGEFRVLHRIPKSRVWHVGTRVIGPQRWSHA